MQTVLQTQVRCQPCSRPAAHAGLVPAPCWRHLPLHDRNVAAHGILDAYRRDKGLPIPGHSGSSSSSSTAVQQKPAKMAANPAADADDSPCPVECVNEIFTPQEFQEALDAAGQTTLVVTDFYKTACGACKFIYPGFVKLCKASTSGQQASSPGVVFLKHNVYDDDEGEVTDLCKKYNVRSVPKFIFFKGGKELESFSTRDKQKVAQAILKHADPGSVEFGDWK